MRRLIPLSLVMLSLTLLPMACDDEGEVTGTGDITQLPDRNEFVSQLERQRNEADNQLQQWRNQLQNANLSDDVRDEYEDRLNELEAAINDVNDEVDDVRNASTDDWPNEHGEAVQDLNTLQQRLQNARQTVGQALRGQGPAGEADVDVDLDLDRD